jgi:hypothetical protein
MYRSAAITAALSLIVSVAATAQSDVDRAFTTTEAKCEGITWSREALAQYPNIASACQDVMERDGRYYVKFSGTVQRVTSGGRAVTVNFKDGNTLELTPPENMSLYIDGRPRTARSLRRGDELTFYVPQDSLAAQPPRVVGVTVIPIARLRVAQATPTGANETTEAPAPALPKTASPLPLIGLSGLVLTIFGLVPWRLRHRRSRAGFEP